MSPTRVGRTLALAAALVILATAALGSTTCTPGEAGDARDRGRERIARLPEPDDALSEDLMVALAQAKNFHHKAKVYMSDGNLAEATDSVRQASPVPSSRASCSALPPAAGPEKKT